MHSLVFISLGFVLSSVVTAFPTLHQSSDDSDFLDLFSSFPRATSDSIAFNPLENLNDHSENLFGNSVYADPSDDNTLLSSDPITVKWDGLSSSDLLIPESESQTNLFDDNLGLIAFSSSPSDVSSLSQFPINQDASYDPLSSSSSSSSSSTLLDGSTLTSPDLGLIAQAPAGPPSCSSLKNQKSSLVYQSLCCDSPCMDIQSWRSTCRAWDSSCPEERVACCQQFNDGPDFHYSAFDCTMAPGYSFTMPDFTLIATRNKCGV